VRRCGGVLGRTSRETLISGDICVSLSVLQAMSQQPAPRPDLREHLAAERTFLAYIRTGLALMGFGFVVARFSLFLQTTLQSGGKETPGLSLWFGTALVMLGVAVNFLSIVEYRSLIERLNQAHGAKWPPARLPVATAALVGTCGVVMASYLIWVHIAGR
jgi:putative membrane protein